MTRTSDDVLVEHALASDPLALSTSTLQPRDDPLANDLTLELGKHRYLQPLTYVYYDLPCSKRDKSFATLSGYERWEANRTRDEHPELDSHLHSVMLIPPTLVQRFNGNVAASIASR